MSKGFIYSRHRTWSEAEDAVEDYYATGEIDCTDQPDIVQRHVGDRLYYCVVLFSPAYH